MPPAVDGVFSVCFFFWFAPLTAGGFPVALFFVIFFIHVARIGNAAGLRDQVQQVDAAFFEHVATRLMKVNGLFPIGLQKLEV